MGLAVRAALLGLLVVFTSRPAGAELQDSIHRVADAWRAVGADVVIGEPRFLQDDETSIFVLPQLPTGACTTVLLLAARGLGFHVTSAEGGGDDATARIPSEAGSLTIERCGEDVPRRLSVTSDSGRGALEALVARSARGLPALSDILPERAASRLGLLTEPGSLDSPPSRERRAEFAEARARRDGATLFERTTLSAGSDGSGAGQEMLAPGCHVLSLYSLDPTALHRGRKGKLDVDAELRDASGEQLLARDRTDAPDAQLPVCVGQTTPVVLLFVGSMPSSPVLVSHVGWPLPDHLPAVWGGEVRARMARILLARHVVSLPRDPSLLAQGGPGDTAVPIATEPGACYVAVVAVAQGSARAIGVRVHVHGRDTFDDRGVDAMSAAAAFCAGSASVARVEVEARGAPPLGWGLAVYRVQNGVWEMPR